MRNFLISSCLIFCLLLPVARFGHTASQNQGYYMEQNGRLTHLPNGDPSKIEAKEWHVRLYKKGQATGGRDCCGLIMGKTAESVMMQLKRSQEFELAFNAWAGRGRVPDKGCTHFNYTGPIAIMRSTADRQSFLDKVQGFINRLYKMQGQFSDLQRYKEQIGSKTPAEQTAFKTVGNVLKEYKDNLLHAQEKLRELEKKLALNNAATWEISAGLREISQELSAAEGHQAMITAKVSSGETSKIERDWLGLHEDEIQGVDFPRYKITDSMMVSLQGNSLSIRGGRKMVSTEDSSVAYVGKVELDSRWSCSIPLETIDPNSMKTKTFTLREWMSSGHSPGDRRYWDISFATKKPYDVLRQTLVGVSGHSEPASKSQQTIFSLSYSNETLAHQAANAIKILSSNPSVSSPISLNRSQSGPLPERIIPKPDPAEVARQIAKVKAAKAQQERAVRQATYRKNYEIGQTALQQGQVATAFTALSTAARADPNRYEPHFGLARIYAKQTNAEATIRELRSMAKQRPITAYELQTHLEFYALFPNPRFQSFVKETVGSETGNKLIAWGAYVNQAVVSDNVPLPLVEAVKKILNRGEKVRIVTFAPDGGWVAAGSDHAYWSDAIPAGLSAKLKDLSMEEKFLSLSFASQQTWSLFSDNFGEGYFSHYNSGNVPQSAYNRIGQHLQTRGVKLKIIAYAPTGGWMIVSSRNGVDSVSASAVGTLPQASYDKTVALFRQNRSTQINYVAYGPKESWIILANRNEASWAGIPQGAINAINKLVQAHKSVDVVALAPNGGWVVVGDQY